MWDLSTEKGESDLAESVKQDGWYEGSKEMRARASGGGYEKESSKLYRL